MEKRFTDQEGTTRNGGQKAERGGRRDEPEKNDHGSHGKLAGADDLRRNPETPGNAFHQHRFPRAQRTRQYHYAAWHEVFPYDLPYSQSLFYSSGMQSHILLREIVHESVDIVEVAARDSRKHYVHYLTV